MAPALGTFPLVPRRRLIGLAFGAMRSARRGRGFDVIGSRAYRPGDDVRAIDWGASARLSAARGTDEFVVRERFTEEAPRVVVVCDRRPEMALFPPGLPWLAKPEAMHVAGSLIADATLKARGLVGYLDYASLEHPDPEHRSDGPFWRPPTSQHEHWRLKEEHLLYPGFHAPADNLELALGYLGELRRTLPTGSFVFVISDFVRPPSAEVWNEALELPWDLVPVIVQDPVWEQSFPAVGGIGVPFADPATGIVRLVRLTRREAEARRRVNEERLARLLDLFESLDLQPVLLSSSEPDDVLNAFLGWAALREAAAILGMKELRRHPTALAMLVAGAVALWLAVVAVRTGWFGSAPELPAGPRVAATASLKPRAHYYGDRVTAELELLFRHDGVPVSSFHVEAPFAPYTVLSSKVERTDAGSATRLLYRFRLLCIRNDCLPLNRRSVKLPRATIRYTPTGSVEQTMRVGWPTVAIASRRVVRFQVRPLLAAHLRPLPELTYRVRPGVLAATAFAGSLALLLLAVGLLFPAIPRTLGVRRPAWLRRRVRPLTPLEQALARVRAASTNGGEDERRALEQLAIELAGEGEGSLARDARRLAWSPGRPPSEGVDGLSDEVERLIGAGR